ncbi:transglycosylase domain-containing protein [Candidatus Shapirobacteria bacterium]|nr:transglycosylase domain-containing protein [Candidatus Shapirobacteria bacterium]
MNLVTQVVKLLIGLGKPVYRLIKFFTRIRTAQITGIILMLIFGGGLWWFYKNIATKLPNVNEIYSPPKLSTTILDKNGALLYKFYDKENRSWVGIDKIPQNLINATIAIEDKDFYKHHGLSFKGILNALIFDFKNRGDSQLRGGSTITQQLVKNVFFPNEEGFKRKIKEAIVTIMLETKLSKQDILERYFNQVPYGGDIYGVEEAARRYFGKNVDQIDLNEAAFLAGLTAAPGSYNPWGDNPELAQLRRKHVLEEMVAAKYISGDDAKKLANIRVVTVNEKPKIVAPHFVFYIKKVLEDKYGFKDVGRLGLTVRTTLDSKVQKMAEGVVKDEVNKVAGLRIGNGAALILDVKNGDILAMVGSKDYWATDIDGKYNVTTSLRQPGSSIKPINYLLAIQKGRTLASVIDDSPVTYYVAGQKPYSPKNYTGRYLGSVTIKTALASSLNVPSVKLLAENGVSDLIDLGQNMGITTWGDRKRFGLSLALGSGEVKMTELAQAYSIFANLGDKVTVDPIQKISNYLGEDVYNKAVSRQKIIDPGQAFLINQALSDDLARAPIFGLNSKLKIGNKTVAVKTGTTNNLKDNWCIGWTPTYLVATWVGNNDATPMSWVASGVSGATPIWNLIMHQLIDKKTDESWSTPNDVYKENVCGKEEYFLTNTNKNIVCPTRPVPTPTNF